ncbi:hypothetical protein A2239_03885 [Candidatus Uhrbacteria bacterium RIFOXYA2_FULL_40_9]|nr:MAG: hypothetical protein A2239_03885 [Candidatus Uhrbacteria bacterium RIFOXYA2_FULL_40_9]OGL97119.1 MAG: hypothetical protein A2332_04150 [Candidatus Uhrbacteria bacterium RIFOXYB2_FULL_41_18]HBK35270.1 hypothetical protein [Candidatus Uhrbacteria bacterium]HCB55427.1 hypothetical protein [Candidatus Uhrbacteria bacterium]
MHQKPPYRYALRTLVIFVILLGAYYVYLDTKLPFLQESSQEEVIISNKDRSKELCDTMTYANAWSLAEASTDCLEAGSLNLTNPDANFCNENSHTWQFVLENVTQEGCGAGCYVHTDTGEVELNWMCTGLINE